MHALLKSKEHELHLVCHSHFISFVLISQMADSCCLFLSGLQLAHALVEHETLNADEVRKVIKGEPIRDIKELLSEDLSPLSTESTPPSLDS